MTELKVMKLRFEPVDPYTIGYEAIFSRIKRLSVLSSMMETPNKYIAVVEVVWHDASDVTVLSDLEFFDRISEITCSGDTYLYLLTGHHLPFYSKLYAEMIETFDCFFQYPSVFEKEKIYMSIAGKKKNLNDFIATLRESDMAFEVVSIRPYYVKGRGILSSLTPKQYDCVKFAVENGLYDIPKRCDTRKLAKKKDISHSTFSMHIRKAEKAIFKELFE
jgi:predicted DNA binding protein